MVRKVLVADDDRLIREAVSDILATDERNHVLLAKDGDEAVKVSLAAKPDLVFLDLHLPNKDGWSVCQFLKSHPDTAHMKVVILTGLTQRSLRQRTLQASPDAIIEKPFGANEILDIVEKLLAGG